MQGDYESVFHKRPVGIEKARETLIKVIAEVREELKLPMSKFVIGGFSQGAMLSTDVCLHLEENPAYLAVMSGMLVAKEDWEKLAPNKKVTTNRDEANLIGA
jgi:phospholipase/carboxylesterase